MRQWEIYSFPYPNAQNPHPCVVLSPDELAGDRQVLLVNVLPCTSFRPADKLRRSEVRLNGADDLDGPSVVRCQLILTFLKSEVGPLYGIVSPERQIAIKRKLNEIFKLHV